MKPARGATYFLAMALSVSLAGVAQAAKISDLRCEYLDNPIGLDARAPRFSWVLEASERGARQTAYQLLVASTPEKLRRGEGDVWDSGKRASDDNAQVPYGGPALASRTRYHWVVRVWDDKGRATSSAPAFFEMGVLDPTSWKARFVGLRAVGDDERLELAAARWIWPAASTTAAGAAPKRVGFRHRFALPPDAQVRYAELVLAAPGTGKPWDPEAQVHSVVNGRALYNFSADVHDPHRIVVTRALKAGDNELAIDMPFVAKRAFIAVVVAELSDGSRRVFPTDKSWRTRAFAAHDLDKTASGWKQEATDKAPWSAATELGAFGDAVNPDDARFKRVDKLVPAILLRKPFTVAKPVAQARLYATAAGIYEMQLNGKKVGTDVLTPGWTDYAKRVRYQSYDVTRALKPGANVLGGIVADGWYSGRTGMGQNLWGFDKGLFAELVVTYADGSTDVVATDESWVGTTGPWRRADLLDGEVYDARRELPGWSTAAFKQGPDWRAAVVIDPKIPRLDAQMDPPPRKIQELVAKQVTSPAPGVQIFDLGQEITGWARVKLRVAPGTVVQLRYAEMLAKDGTAFTDNLRTANATDRYVARGGRDEVYESRFTFHGFRYVEATAIAGTLPKLSPAAVTGVVVHNDLRPTGKLETSNAMLNKLQSNIVWGQKGNFLSVPTDCPQRDERLGWTGDINMFARTALFNMDAAPFLAKYLVDLEDGQHADGAFPDVAPTTAALGAGSFGWGDVGVFLPWLLYEVAGDAHVLEHHYDAMKRWVDFRTAHAKGWLNTSWSFGDWVSPPPQTPNDVLSPMYHAQAARLLARSARVLRKNDDAAKYEDAVAKIKDAWNKAFVTPDGKIKSDTQTAYIVALRYDMLPENLREPAARHLVAAIERANRHLNTGFLGTGNLLPALSIAKQDALAWELLLKDTYPSWLFTVKNGATTMWERWDSYSPETGPSNKGDMNSYNHYAFGAVGEWMVAHVAGLDDDADAPGFRRIVVRPVLGGGLTHARAERRTIRGTTSVAWKLAGDKLTMDVEVPVHATARVHVPTSRPDAVTEGGHPVAGVPGVKPLPGEPGYAVFEVSSGRYRFAAPH